MVTVKINIEKKHLYIFSAIIGVVLGLLVVNAYNDPPVYPASPSTMGHSMDEINWNTPIVQAAVDAPALSISRDASLIKVMRLVPNLGTSGYNPISQTGDVGLIFTGGSSEAINTGNLVIAPWATTARGIRMDNEGRVGIGVSSPQATLDVGGPVRIQGNYAINKIQTGSVSHGACGGGSWTDPVNVPFNVVGAFVAPSSDTYFPTSGIFYASASVLSSGSTITLKTDIGPGSNCNSATFNWIAFGYTP